MASLLGGDARGASALPLLVHQQTIDHTTGPQCAGIDVEIVKRHAGIFVDGPLLCLQHRHVLVVDTLAVIDVRAINVTGELRIVCRERANEVPEIMTGPLRLRCDGS